MFSEAMLTTIAEEQFRSSSLIDDSLARLFTCLRGLSVDKRKLLERCYSGERSIKAIATENGMQPEALYKQLERIRRTLLECIRIGQAAEETRDG